MDSYAGGRGFKSKRITRIRCAARKVVLFENADAPAMNSGPLSYETTGPRLYIALRHHGRSNVCYADGHVELFDPLELTNDGAASVRENAVSISSFHIDPE